MNKDQGQDELLHYGGNYSHADPFAIPSVGEHGYIVRCGHPREDVQWVGAYLDWARVHVEGRPCCLECTRIVAVETGAVAGSA